MKYEPLNLFLFSIQTDRHTCINQVTFNPTCQSWILCTFFDILHLEVNKVNSHKNYISSILDKVMRDQSQRYLSKNDAKVPIGKIGWNLKRSSCAPRTLTSLAWCWAQNNSTLAILAKVIGAKFATLRRFLVKCEPVVDKFDILVC